MRLSSKNDEPSFNDIGEDGNLQIQSRRRMSFLAVNHTVVQVNGDLVIESWRAWTNITLVASSIGALSAAACRTKWNNASLDLWYPVACE